MNHQEFVRILMNGNCHQLFYRMLAVVLCCGFAGLPVLGQQGNVSVQCLDENGEPVVMAEVWLFQGDGERYELSGPFVSNMGGEAVCGKEVLSNQDGNFDRWIYARIRGKLVGVARTMKWKNRELFNVNAEVLLRPSRSVKGSVRAPDGVDPSVVTVRVQVLHIRSGDGMFDFDSFPRHGQFPGLDTGLKEIFECHPHADGTFELHDLPEAGRVYLNTVAAGFGQAQWMSSDWTMEPDAELVLKPEITLTGRVSLPDEKPGQGVTVNARLQSGEPFNPGFLSTFTAKTNDHGEFKIHQLPHARFSLSVESPDEALVFVPVTDLTGEPGKGLNLDLKLQRSVIISGKVTDAEGRPVEGAAISAISTDLKSGLDDAITDKEGKYELRVPAIAVSLYFNSLPDGFEYPEPQVVKTLAVEQGQERIENIDLTLKRTRE